MAKERGHLTDDDLKRLVSDALFTDPKVTIGSEIVVLVEDGEVTLRGSVGTFGDKREANKAASRVYGVQSVKDELKVLGLTDSDLRRHVLEALELDTRIPATIDVTVTEGFVTLLGVVESQHQRDAAGFIARYVPGVVEIENQIAIKDAEESAQGLDEPDGGEVEGSNGELLNRIAKLDRALTGAGDTSRRELEARLAAAGRRIERVRMASDAAGNVVKFRVTRYVQSLESNAIDAIARLAALTDPQSYEEKQLERDVAALEVEVSEAEAELEAALAEERGDLRGETEGEVRAIEVETDAIRARLEHPFRKKD